MTERQITAVHVPRRVDDGLVPAYVRRATDKPIDELCMQTKTTGTGRWVCVLDAGHDGKCV